MSKTKEEMKAEAIKRMKFLGVCPEVIRQFEEDGTVNETSGRLGACCRLSDEQKERVARIEEKLSAVVYHVVHGVYDMCGEIAEMETMLYVSDEEEDWECDWEDLKQKHAVAYVYNKTYPGDSEIGGVGIELTSVGGLKRTY